MPLLYANCKAQVDKVLAKELPDCKGVCFTADYWTSRAADPYLGMTLHYINSDFQLKKFLVSCRSADYRHTAINIGSHMDKVIRNFRKSSKLPSFYSKLPNVLKLNILLFEITVRTQSTHIFFVSFVQVVGAIAGLRGNTLRTCVTDNAANMLAAVPKHTKKIDVGLACFDHLLNLVVKAANLANDHIQDAIKDCKSFSARVHHSSPDHQRIRRECYLLKNDSNPIECEFRKVITDVDTRWNSTYFLLKSIHLLRPALDSIRDDRYEDEKTNPDFKAKIPSPLTFEIIAQILPVMEKAELLSRIMSADQKPTICEVSIRFFRISSNLTYFLAYFLYNYKLYMLFYVVFV